MPSARDKRRWGQRGGGGAGAVRDWWSTSCTQRDAHRGPIALLAGSEKVFVAGGWTGRESCPPRDAGLWRHWQQSLGCRKIDLASSSVMPGAQEAEAGGFPYPDPNLFPNTGPAVPGGEGRPLLPLSRKPPSKFMIYSPGSAHIGRCVLIAAEDGAGGGDGRVGLNSPSRVGREEAQTAAESAWGQRGEAGQAPIPQQLVSSWSLSPPSTAPGTGRRVRGGPA